MLVLLLNITYIPRYVCGFNSEQKETQWQSYYACPGKA